MLLEIRNYLIEGEAFGFKGICYVLFATIGYFLNKFRDLSGVLKPRYNLDDIIELSFIFGRHKSLFSNLSVTFIE